MKYILQTNQIRIISKDDFNPKHILECGQIFSFEEKEGTFVVLSRDKIAEIVENEEGYLIKTKDVEYFENFFDLKTDYGAIKKRFSKIPILKEPIKFGYGIRILKQDLFETLISFIVSANNNIKRIKLILNRLRENFGTNIGNFYAFPTHKQLLQATEEDFGRLGAGYRAKYLFNVLRQIDEKTLEEWKNLDTLTLRKKLIGLSGVGPKVADCILLFAFEKSDVFPIDTWMEKMYNKFYKTDKILTREKIRHNLTEEFKNDSGYAQQYLFYYMREEIKGDVWKSLI